MFIEPLRTIVNFMPYEARQRLSLLLDGIIEGKDKVLLSPLGENINPIEILQGWDSIFKDNVGDMNDILLELEINNRSKYGPRSIAVPWADRKEGVLGSFEEANGRKQLIKWVPAPYKRLRPLSVQNAVKYIKRQTNSGLPSLLKKGTVLDSMNWGSKDDPQYNLFWPAVMFTRTQEQRKTRTVWGYPLLAVLFEMCYYRPMLEFQRGLPWRAALRSPDDIDQAITDLILYAIEMGMSLVSIDFRNFDDSVKYPLQEWFFRIYCTALYQADTFEWASLLKIFSSIPLVTPSGIFQGKHGIPSGSAFTNEAGSCIQHGIAQDYFEPIKHDQQQGDDGVYPCYYPDSLKDHFRSYGLEVNDDKSYVSNEYCVYLQNLYHIDYMEDGIIRGIYCTYRALCRIVFQERFNDFSKDDISGKDYYAIRTLSILETCKHHPLFRELVRYVWSLDQYNLSFSDQGLVAYVKMREKQDGKDVKFTEYKRGDKISGIREFASYKLVQEFNGK